LALRVLTTACIVGTILLFFLSVFQITHAPERSDAPAVKRRFARRLIWFTGAEMLTLVASGVGSVLIVRQARQEYRDSAMRNMKLLVEAAKEDQHDA